MMEEDQIQEIVRQVTDNFRCFGGGKTSNWNPLMAALADTTPQFAAGVRVEEVVRFVLQAAEAQNAPQN